MRCGDLIGLPIVTRSGRRAGHVVDLRIEPRDDQAPVVAVMHGRAGVLERLGLRAAHARPIAWARVIEIRPDALVVDLPDSIEPPRDGRRPRPVR